MALKTLGIQEKDTQTPLEISVNTRRLGVPFLQSTISLQDVFNYLLNDAIDASTVCCMKPCSTGDASGYVKIYTPQGNPGNTNVNRYIIDTSDAGHDPGVSTIYAWDALIDGSLDDYNAFAGFHSEMDVSNGSTLSTEIEMLATMGSDTFAGLIGAASPTDAYFSMYAEKDSSSLYNTISVGLEYVTIGEEGDNKLVSINTDFLTINGSLGYTGSVIAGQTMVFNNGLLVDVI